MLKWLTVGSATLSVAVVMVACGEDSIKSGESTADYAARLAAYRGASFVTTALETLGREHPERAITEDALIGRGYSLLMDGRIDESMDLQQASTQLFPNSARAWDNLGEVAIYVGDRALAQRSLQRAIELDSNSSAAWRLPNLDIELREAAAETQEMNRYAPGAATGLTGPYLGQQTPGNTPQVFAPGIVSTRGGHEFSITFSPDGHQLYFNRGPNIYGSYWRDDGWTAPAPVSFNSDYLDHEPHISHDGQQLYFGSGRPRDGATGDDVYGIWVMQRVDDGWDEPEYLFPGMYVTTALNGNAYVTDIFNVAGGGICVYRMEHAGYQLCERLRGGVNTHRSAHPLIAPDESYLIFDANEGFYISFPDNNRTWSDPIQLEEITTFGSNMTASLSPDGRFLFYYANHDIYWVSTDILQPYIAAYEQGHN
jgi:hypothetical protein